MLIKVNWNPSGSELRKFGLVILAGFGLIGGLAFWRGRHCAAACLWTAAAAVEVAALAAPRLAAVFYQAWMAFGFAMGTVVSTAALLAFFYLIVTPIGLVMRLLGRDALNLRRPRGAAGSYWVEHPDLADKRSLERLF
ncbi:MAG: SxtJ family membrane protein [Elusimicrobia bacterium]|nr:SxtJ family membrane protein [Elusimicrobiota bacterium]